MLSHREWVLRQNILGKVSVGRWAPKTAEKVAERISIDQFELTPEASSFDPMRESRWSLPMVLAWLVFRSVDKVREQWDSFRCEFYEWQFVVRRLPTSDPYLWETRRGHELKQRANATLSEVELISADIFRGDDVPILMFFDSAKSELWRALQDNRLQCEVVDVQGMVVEVPEREWAYLDARDSKTGITLRYLHSSQQVVYSDLKFKRASILSFWPSSNADSNQSIAADNTHTGYAGRPTSRSLIAAEFKRRRVDGTLSHSISQAAKQLSDWLKTTHPSSPPAKQKSIENSIRAEFNHWKADGFPKA